LKLILSLFLILPLFAAELSDHQKIKKLLEAVEQSNLTFIRNGKEYDASKARKHLEYKYNYVLKGFWFWQKGEKVTVKKFIDKIASGSSTTGKPYYIKTNAGTKVPTKEWLYKKLKEIESSQ